MTTEGSYCRYTDCDEPVTHAAAWSGGMPFDLCRRHARAVRDGYPAGVVTVTAKGRRSGDV
jgi:hypothetical protein